MTLAPTRDRRIRSATLLNGHRPIGTLVEVQRAGWLPKETSDKRRIEESGRGR
jgi:hypothetical protein